MDGKKKLEELVAGLDGVTPGPWYLEHVSVGDAGGSVAECIDGPVRANAAHIARCDPDSIRSISDAYKATEAENERLRALIAADDDAHRSIVKEADESDYYRPGESGYSRADEEWFFDMDGKP